MRLLLAFASLILSTNLAPALTQPEIAAALSVIAKNSQEFRECLRTADGKLEQTTEVKDINGDGVEEIILVETSEIGSTNCFGRAGQISTLLMSDGAGKWRTAIGDNVAASFNFLKRSDSSWPDVEIGGAGFCHPVWRMQESKRAYEPWKVCEDGRLVMASGSRPTLTLQPASIGMQAPVEIYKGKLDGPPYDHNGSIVIIDAEKGLIVYDKPKRSIAGTVAPGTVLFRGKPWNSGDPDAVIRGTAYVFKKGCPAAGYEVRGLYHHDFQIAQLTFEGAAPVRSKASCDIVGHSSTSGNAKLRFDIAIE